MEYLPTKPRIVIDVAESVRASTADERERDATAELAPYRWQELLRAAVRDSRQLLARVGLSSQWLPGAEAGSGEFSVFAPEAYIAKMKFGDPYDPLLLQVLPRQEELEESPGFVRDPVGDAAAKLGPGLLHKYAGRALLVTTGACAIHCRYCFRRHYPYSESPRSAAAWEPALAQIAADSSIREVILSGGDPLTLVDATLAEIVERIAAIPSVVRLRVHTRLPIVIPERVTDELLAWLRGTRLAPIMVVHANHPQELDAHVLQSLGKLVDAGVPVLNQAVLLRGINDSVATLVELCERLINARVLPYYLHQLDRVAGAAHFEVPIERGRELVAQLRSHLPGYAMPQYVVEQAGEGSKSLLM